MKLAKMPDGSPEIFFTLQGEGRNTGCPSVFIRASLCNLHCHWCDTDYTWNWLDTPHAHERDADPAYRKHRREDQIVELTTEEIVSAVSAYPCRNFVFTGGEPLIQEKAWLSLMAALDAQGGPAARCEVETNGTLLPSTPFLERIDQLNVSPKLSNSGVAEALRKKDAVLASLAATGKADFKFVIGTETDLGEALRIVEASGIERGHVFLMPRARSPEELDTRHREVADMALAHGFRYSDRLHLRLYGAKRGV